MPGLERIERLEEHREDWTRLAEATGHPFATWEWNSVWWRHFGGERELYSFACRDGDGEVVAILPMYLALRRPVGVARLLGYADLQSPVCAPEHRAAAARALDQVTRRPYPARLVFAERLPGDQGWEGLLGGRRVHTDATPILEFNGRSWDEVMAVLNRKHRNTLRRGERRLLERHQLVYRLATAETLDADLGTLFRLHAARWADETTGVFAGPGAAFHREFAAAALEGGWLRLWIAEVEGEPAAAWYGFRFAGIDWHYQGGRDPRFDKLSVGRALWTHTVREACNDGLRAYHFLAGNEPYKLHFASGDPGAESLLAGRPAIAALAAAAISAKQRLGR
jgi:CelD/BcsL family acetyltransferase involved in cellulose biosynthesis